MPYFIDVRVGCFRFPDVGHTLIWISSVCAALPHFLVHSWLHTTPMRQAMGIFFELSCYTLARTPAALPVAGRFAEQWPISLTVFFALVLASLLAVLLHFDSLCLKSIPPAGTNDVPSFGAFATVAFCLQLGTGEDVFVFNAVCQYQCLPGRPCQSGCTLAILRLLFRRASQGCGIRGSTCAS